MEAVGEHSKPVHCKWWGITGDLLGIGQDTHECAELRAQDKDSDHPESDYS